MDWLPVVFLIISATLYVGIGAFFIEHKSWAVKSLSIICFAMAWLFIFSDSGFIAYLQEEIDKQNAELTVIYHREMVLNVLELIPDAEIVGTNCYVDGGIDLIREASCISVVKDGIDNRIILHAECNSGKCEFVSGN